MTKMREAMHSVGNYEAAFTISQGEQQLLGSFAVEGDRYRIEMLDMEVFGEATERYEVNKQRREVTIMQTDLKSADILSNPAHALALVGEQYRAVLLTEQQSEATLSLQVDAAMRDAIRLTINKKTYLPQTIVYLMDGLELKIEIHAIKPLEASLPTFDAAAYPDYEMIDFR